MILKLKYLVIDHQCARTLILWSLNTVAVKFVRFTGPNKGRYVRHEKDAFGAYSGYFGRS